MRTVVRRCQVVQESQPRCGAAAGRCDPAASLHVDRARRRHCARLVAAKSRRFRRFHISYTQVITSKVPMMSSYCLDVEMFISEVKKHPEIWDLNSEDNRFKTKKQHAWSEIARVFIADFDDMPNIEKMDVYRKLHGKWRNIRDSYVRHVKRKYGKRRGYVYARYLTFLNDLYNKNTSQSGSEVECENDEQSDEEDANLKRLGFKNRKFELINDSSVWASDAEDSPSIIDNLKRKRCNKQENDVEYVDTPFPDATCSYSSPVGDEDRSFFESLLPAVREFNMDQKLQFRSEVLCLIKNIRSSNGRINFIKLDPATGDFH